MPRESDKLDITPNDRVHKAARDMTPDLKSIIRSIERRDFETAHRALNAYMPAPEHQDFAHYLRGVTCAHLAHFDDAITAFQRCCLPSAPTEWWSNFGVCAKDAGHWKALTEVAQELNRREANDAQSLLVRIEDSRRHCRFEDALDLAKRLASDAPDLFTARLTLANSLKDFGRYEQAAQAFTHALELEPGNTEALWNLTLNELSQGSSGFERFEQRFERSPPPFLEYVPTRIQRMCRDTPPHRACLVISEQGFGDTLQYARYLPSIQRRHEHIGWVAPRRLVQLLSSSFPNIRFIDKDDIVESEWDTWMPLMSAPYLKYSESAGPYLIPPAVEPAAELLEAARGKILLNWYGSSAYIHDYWRSLTTAQVLPFVRTLGPQRLASIQHGLTKEARENLPNELILLGDDIDQGEHGFLETAVILRAALALVTTDTAIAHLAGALGVSTHLILGPLADWRWEWQKSTTPWYPTMTLHRWKTPEDLPKLAKEIEQLLT